MERGEEMVRRGPQIGLLAIFVVLAAIGCWLSITDMQVLAILPLALRDNLHGVWSQPSDGWSVMGVLAILSRTYSEFLKLAFIILLSAVAIRWTLVSQLQKRF